MKSDSSSDEESDSEDKKKKKKEVKKVMIYCIEIFIRGFAVYVHVRHNLSY